VDESDVLSTCIGKSGGGGAKPLLSTQCVLRFKLQNIYPFHTKDSIIK